MGTKRADLDQAEDRVVADRVVAKVDMDIEGITDALCLRILLQGQIPCLLCSLLLFLWTEVQSTGTR